MYIVQHTQKCEMFDQKEKKTISYVHFRIYYLVHLHCTLTLILLYLLHCECRKTPADKRLENCSKSIYLRTLMLEAI